MPFVRGITSSAMIRSGRQLRGLNQIFSVEHLAYDTELVSEQYLNPGQDVLMVIRYQQSRFLISRRSLLGAEIQACGLRPVTITPPFGVRRQQNCHPGAQDVAGSAGPRQVDSVWAERRKISDLRR